MSKTAPLQLDLSNNDENTVVQTYEKLQLMKNRIRNDRETQNIIDGFANSILKLQKATNGGKKIEKAIGYYLQFSEQLLSNNESIAAANSILELNVPQKKEDLMRLNVTIKHCIECFRNDMESVKTLYKNIIDNAMKEIPDSDCPSNLQDSLIRKIEYCAETASEVIDQTISRGEETIVAINEYNRENNAYHFGYRTVLHGILLFVAFGIVITNGLHTYEIFIIIGFVLYIILENSWWGYAKHKVTVAKNGIEEQMKKMHSVKEQLEQLASSS